MKKITTVVVISVIAILVLYDIWAGVIGGTSATISGRIWAWSEQWPEIPFLFGALMGHFFWRW